MPVLLWVCSNLTYGQDYTTTELYLNIKTDADEPVTHTPIWLVETVSGQELPSITNSKGSVNFTVDKGKSYTVNFKDKKEVATITISPKQTTLLAKTIRYNPPVQTNQTDILAHTQTDTVFQQLVEGTIVHRTEILVRIKIFNMDQQPLKDMPVSLFNQESHTCYMATTGSTGQASFLVYPDKEYHIGLAGMADYQTFSTPAIGGLTVERIIKFEPTQLAETNINDTIHQVIPQVEHGTSDRALVRVLINNYNRIGLADEGVWANVIGENTVYHAITNAQGMAYFLLPKGKKYTLHFKYDRDVDVWDYTDMRGVVTSDVEFTYIGSANIENFYNTVKRDKNGFITEFMNVQTTPAKLDLNSYLETTSLGFNLNLGVQKIMMPPTAYRDRIFITNGVQTNHIYSFNATTGAFSWGAQLMEGGVSASVVAGNTLMLITESCTLYAFDINTGKLLWSKWLSEFMYSSPTASGEQVYAVYKDGLTNQSNYMAVCFNISDGKILWQKRLEADILTTPVVCDDKVYITTQSGILYQLDAFTGNETGKINHKAIGLPTITADQIIIAELDPADTTKVVLASYHKDFTSRAELPLISGGFIYEPIPTDYLTLMYNAHLRVAQYQGLCYLMHHNMIYCIDPAAKKIAWSQSLDNNPEDNGKYATSNMPVIAGGQIVVATSDGNINMYDPKTGSLLQQLSTGKPIISQPIVHNGWIYIGTAAGNLIALNTKNTQLTGWSTWCGNASHNPVFK
jgi:outer membrane protein assembly factor BamB